MFRKLTATYYYPPLAGDNWERTSLDLPGWNEAIADTLAYVKGKNSTAFLVLHKGKIVVEQYWQGWDIQSSDIIHSAAKSVTSVLIGIVREQGKLRIEDRVSKHLGQGWTKAPPEKEDRVTVRHLLTMTSGLDQNLDFEADAGTTWFYNSPAYWKLFPVIEAATGKSMNDFFREALWSRIGMRKCAWGPRPLICSARDMARFGLMMLSNGQWNGEDIIQDKAFLQETTSTSQCLNESYGYLWWLNGKSSYCLPGPAPERVVGALVPTAPADMFAALGAGDKRIYIVPSLDLVVVRHGEAAGELRSASSSFDGQILAKLLACDTSHSHYARQ